MKSGFDSSANSFVTKIVALGLSLACSLVVLRGFIVTNRGRDFLCLLAASGSDLAYATTVTLTAAVAAFLMGRSRRASQLVYTAFVALTLISVFTAWINIPAVKLLGQPFTYPWLQYSDFFRSQDSRSAAAANCTWQALVAVALQLAAMFGSARLFRWGLDRLSLRRRFAPAAICAIAALCGVCFLWAPGYARQCKLTRGQISNPVTVFLVSVIEAHRAPQLLTLKTSLKPDDVMTIAERGPRESLPVAGREKIRNVVVFVLESTGAEYTDLYGASYGVTPNLLKCRSQAMLFENAYAHRPSTDNMLVSLLCSIYPPPSYGSFTTDYDHSQLEALTDVLKRTGYHTSFFGSGDWTYARMNEFLTAHSVEKLEDCHDRPNEMLLDTYNGYSAYRTDDVLTVDSFGRFISHAGTKPFFSVVWTDMTHYPYSLIGKEQPIVSQADTQGQMLNRYLNALRRSDEALGRLLELLKQHGLTESTLVVVVGDHGEAFARHDTYGHASSIYDENVHVPLLLMNPALFHGETNSTVCGVVDIAPTVLHMLGVQVPGGWQGRSLFEKERSDRAYFHSPYSECLYGFREGTKTFLFNASTGAEELYDLKSDRIQSQNLATKHPDLVPKMRERLAAWVQYQTLLLKSMTSAPKTIK